MFTSIIDWVVNNYGTLTALGTGAVASLLFLKKWIKNAIRTIHIGNKFIDTFGDEPAAEIKKIYEAIQRSNTTSEIRQQISEMCLQIGIYICDTKGGCLWTNDYLNQLFGLDSEDMKGFGWMSSIDYKDRDPTFKLWMNSVTNNLPYDAEYVINNKITGKSHLVITHAVSILNDKDNIVSYVGYLKIKATKIDKKKKGIDEEATEKDT